MNRKIFFFSGIIIALAVLFTFQSQVKKFFNYQESEKQFEEREDFAARDKQMFLMLRDPATNEISKYTYILERQFLESIPQRLFKGQSLTWVERGPNNIAGRVRSLGIDVRTTTAPNITIITGGVSGGIWKTTNNGASWSKTTTPSQLHSVTHIIQDTRAGKQDTWYAGSGENDNGNSASGGYIASFFGDGLFKSTDNGNTWNPIASTQSNSISSWVSDWQFVWRLAIDKSNTAQDVVYAATNGGVYKTQNGGTSWTKIFESTQGLTVANNVQVDIATADNGTLYVAGGGSAGLDAFTNIKGIRKSTDGGTTFTNITPALMPQNFGRIILAIAPSNNNILYFLVQGTSGNNSTPSKGKENCQLWRSSDAGNSWTNISSVIPDSAPDVENFQTQGGYDMILNVKPDNPNFVVFGGVSLFKVHDVTNDNLTWQQKHIGGYGASSTGTANALNDFINEHPDHHYGFFLPGNSNVFYSGSDGGISFTNDITQTSNMNTFWQPPIRTGLNISQPYAISIAPEAGSGFLACGYQDRGNWMAKVNNVGNTPANWSEQGGGDGTICAIAPDPLNTVFHQTTNGNISRYAKDQTTAPVSTTFIQPTGSTNLQFVNPYILDPNNGNLLYFSGANGSTTGGGVWRNTSATTATETNGWQFLSNSTVADCFVSALCASTTNSTNVLYYGTSTGKVYRMDNANTGSPTRVEITGPNFPQGYVNCITVDPTNSSNAIVVFSNYNVDRLWYTTDAGTTWTSISGNLNGAAAPSVRWAKLFFVSNQLNVFLATSVGVFRTNTLSGSNTVWAPEAQTTIGNVVCVMLDYRSSDNTLVVATHGRGSFSTQVTGSGTTVPTSPTSLTATVASQSQINLAWQDNSSDETGFKVDRRLNPTDAWTTIATLNANTTSYNNTQLTDGTKYYYRVYAYNAVGNSTFSNEANAITTMNAPSSLSAQLSSGSAILTWTDNSQSEDGYTIERKDGSAGQYSKLTDVGSNVNTYTDAGVAGHQYFYRVKGFNANTSSAYSNETSVSATAPSSPTNLTALVISSSQINLAWQDNSTDETGFKVDRRLNPTDQWTTINTTQANAVFYNNTSLTDGTKYYYRVYAFNANGNSTFSNEVNAVTTMLAPTNLTAQLTNAQAVLHWTDNSQSEDGYTIEKKDGASGTFTKLIDAASNSTAYTDVAVVAGHQYFYRVKGFNANTSSSYSNEANVTVTAVREGEGIPTAFALMQNYPNPFNPSTTIKFAVPNTSQVAIDVYDLNGQKIATLLNEEKAAGYYSVIWNGKNTNGNDVSSGIYLYSIRAGNFSEVKKMLMVK
jgi:photosystem II stability/assembly factor-like uncharacterized protein